MQTRLKLPIVAYLFIAPLALLGAAEERSGLGALLIVVLGIFVGVFVVVELLRERSRGRVMSGQARRLGLAYSAKDPFGLLDMPFALIRRSRSTVRAVDNVLWGRWGDLEIRVFDYAYQESEDEWRRFTGATAFVEGWPTLVIEPETLATSVAHLLGLHDIEFESERFNRAFEVRCEDRRFANAFIDARMMEWLLELSPRWGFELSGTGSSAIASRPSRRRSSRCSRRSRASWSGSLRSSPRSICRAHRRSRHGPKRLRDGSSRALELELRSTKGDPHEPS